MPMLLENFMPPKPPGKRKPKICPICDEPMSDNKIHVRHGERMCLECAEHSDNEDWMREDAKRHEVDDAE